MKNVFMLSVLYHFLSQAFDQAKKSPGCVFGTRGDIDIEKIKKSKHFQALLKQTKVKDEIQLVIYVDKMSLSIFYICWQDESVYLLGQSINSNFCYPLPTSSLLGLLLKVLCLCLVSIDSGCQFFYFCHLFILLFLHMAELIFCEKTIFILRLMNWGSKRKQAVRCQKKWYNRS